MDKITDSKEKDGGNSGRDKVYEIIVNGQKKEVKDNELCFKEVVDLAYDGNPPQGDNWSFTVTYRRGHGNKQGELFPGGDCVKVKEGMIFDVTATDKS